jgi:hypothetical protein
MAVSQPLLMRQTVFAAAVETTTGTAESLSASNADFNIYDSKIDQDSELSERQGQSALSPLQGVAGSQGADVEFATDVVGKGSAGVPSNGIFLQAAGFAVSSQTYTIQTGSASAITLTCGKYVDGRLKQAAGTMLDLVIKLKAGQPARFEYKGKGAWVVPTDVAILAPTYPTTLPPRFASATFTVGGTAYLVDEIEIALNNEIALRQDPSQASGFLAAVITNRKITVKLAPEAKLLASQNWYAAYVAGTQYALSIPIGASANNIITITAPKLQLLKPPADGDRDGVYTEELEFQSCRSAAAGDDDLVITYT